MSKQTKSENLSWTRDVASLAASVIGQYEPGCHRFQSLFFPLQVSSNGRGLLDVSRASRVHGVRPSEDVQGLRLLRNGLPGGLNV